MLNLFTFTLYKLTMIINTALSLFTRRVYQTFLHLFTMLFLTCFGLCSATIREIIHILHNTIVKPAAIPSVVYK
jgi:hypothetical protein